jgi:hypothetical protein
VELGQKDAIPGHVVGVVVLRHASLLHAMLQVHTAIPMNADVFLEAVLVHVVLRSVLLTHGDDVADWSRDLI